MVQSQFFACATTPPFFLKQEAFLKRHFFHDIYDQIGSTSFFSGRFFWLRLHDFSSNEGVLATTHGGRNLFLLD